MDSRVLQWTLWVSVKIWDGLSHQELHLARNEPFPGSHSIIRLRQLMC
jgi:hypothetical protein